MKRLASVLLILGLASCALALSRFGKVTKDLVMAEGDLAKVDERLSLVLDGFTVPRYPSGRPRQYLSAVKVLDVGDRNLRSFEIRVNRPLRVAGWWIYQFGYGADETNVPCTQLRCVRDPLLLAAAAGGCLVLLGALLTVVARRRDFRAAAESAAPAWRKVLCRAAALAVVALPVFIIGRAVMRPEPMPALQSGLMAPHVAAYAASYLLLLFAAFGIGRRFVPLGFALMTLGLVLGALWGKLAWGDWWQYDPKENWSFFTWLAFALALHFPPDSRTFRWLLRLGAVLIVVTLTWVNFSRFAAGIHSYAG